MNSDPSLPPCLVPPCAVSFAECCRQLGISVRTGERLVSDGSFPIPPLPYLGTGRKRERRTYSPYEIELYLREASVRERAQLRVAGARR